MLRIVYLTAELTIIYSIISNLTNYNRQKLWKLYRKSAVATPKYLPVVRQRIVSLKVF